MSLGKIGIKSKNKEKNGIPRNSTYGWLAIIQPNWITTMNGLIIKHRTRTGRTRTGRNEGLDFIFIEKFKLDFRQYCKIP